MLDAAAEREARERRWQARMVANLCNIAGRPLKRAVTEDDVLGIAPPRKRYRWRTAAEVMREDQRRAAKEGECEARA